MSQFISEDSVNASITFRQMLKGLWPYAKRHPALFVSATISVVGVATTSRLLPTIVGYAIDHGVTTKDAHVLAMAAYAFLAVEVAQSLFLFLYSFLFQRLGNRILYYLREDLVRHVQSLPMEYFNKTPTGRIITRLTNDTATLGEVFTDGLINIFTETAILISIVVSMLLISAKLTLFTLVLTPIFLFAGIRITDRIRRILRESKKRLSILNSYVAENLSGIKVVQLFNRVDRNRSRFSDLSKSYRNTLLESIQHYALMQPIMNLFNAVTITAALYWGGVWGAEGSLGLGVLVAFLMHVQDIIHPLREILDKFQQFQNSLTSAERVFQLLGEQSESTDKTASLDGKKFAGKIEFKDLTFKYSPSLPEVLQNINLLIQPGQHIALIGRTRSGKTTMISLLQRFYSAPNGSILIDDVALETIDLKVLRTRVGVVQQDNFIFRGNIRDNVSLGEKSITDQKVQAALEAVGYSKLLRRSGRTLQSHVDEKGANLSVGERQLIAFARIIAFEPDILILDEATANIDSETEKLIQSATKKVIEGRTSLIIAHRLSTIKECDKIIVLDEGRIAEVGSHEQLVKKNGLYARALQQDNFEEVITSN